MYGYVQVYRPDLRFREYEIYRSHYCGLCHTLQQRCNAISRLTLSYDFTFLSLLLDALYEPEADTHKQRCFCGIGKKTTVYHSAVLDYVADMHLFFAYLHCKDDWNDEHSIPHAMLAAGIKTAYHRICNAYPQKTAAILEHMQQLTALEQQQETQFALPAACFGRALAESFCMEQSDVICGIWAIIWGHSSMCWMPTMICRKTANIIPTIHFSRYLSMTLHFTRPSKIFCSTLHQKPLQHLNGCPSCKMQICYETYYMPVSGSHF